MMLRHIATVGGYTMLSRLAGFARDILVAAYLGAGPVADAFFVAFKFPNFFRRLSGEGAFSVAFIPMFSGMLATKGQQEALAFAHRTIAVMAAVMLGFLLVMELAMPWAMHVIAPGFSDNPAQFALAVELTRITFPYLPLISFVALMGGMLNATDRFAAMAAAPIMLNLSLIAALFALVPYTETPGHALAWGVLVAGFVQFFWLLIACRQAGMTIRLVRPRLTPDIRRLFRLILPAAIGAGVMQINLMVDVLLASLLPTGAISYLYYADRINQLPLGVVGIAIGTALLPLLSRQVKRGEDQAALDSQNRGLEVALLLTLPATAGLLVLAQPIIEVLFERGAFVAADTRATALALAAYCLGLPAYVLVKVLAPGFYAREDTATPVKVAVGAMLVNLVLGIALMQVIAHVGLALATAAASWVNAGLLGLILARRGIFRVDARLRRRSWRILLSSLAMTAVLLGGLELYTATRGLEPALRALGLAGLVALGALVYAIACQITGAARLGELKAMLRRKP
ncbi:MAG: murein biosynthesis integral membrane protein MurJ [Alphaproteobacteria bacterium]|nr:murein biosynthesis integral membrane protein MurJ [Alphaproteobacteria bacterium]MBU0886383.1 murein biosynthesis integral membrane protein MurJ [Alphaproteobacteria bacterium]MBU1813421.1 murein biosynthesis integral membrane protein MurJ [Alphaproteobacteria bacterium]